MSEVLTWLPVGLSAVALIVAMVALLAARSARRIATPTPAMRQLGERLTGPEGPELLAELSSQLTTQEGRLRELETAREVVAGKLRGAVQKIGLQRFNSEQGIGGNLSFALVLLDERNHGFILTSVYNLESCRIFLRGIVSGKTDHPLMPEEQEALAQALRA